jgi:hypothetical protein
MSDHKARAREIATEYETMCVSSGIGRPFGFAGLYLLIAEALRTVRIETLEEAAKVCDEAGDDGSFIEGEVWVAKQIAQAIRSLSEDKETSAS